MPKKILFESAVHQFVTATQEILEDLKTKKDGRLETWSKTVASWQFEYKGPKIMLLKWTSPKQGERLIEYSQAKFYTRGDSEKFVQRQREMDLIGVAGDDVEKGNRTYFKEISLKVLAEALE